MYRLKMVVFLLLVLTVPEVAHAANPTAIFEKALKAEAAKNFPMALDLFEDCIRADPENLRYGSEYRQTAIQAQAFDRSIQFFAKLTAEHPASAHAFLNFGFAYVDKIPAAGSIGQVILANKALTQFSKALELKPEWISYYTRGNSYLFWPKVFGWTPRGIADLEQAMKIQKHQIKRPYYVRTYIALGDAYWKMDDLPRARSVWREGLKRFPQNKPLKSRLEHQGEGLKSLIESVYDPTKRVDTDLSDLWMKQ